MNGPRTSINDARVICWSPLDERHITAGSCHRTIDGVTKSPYAGVAIGQRPGNPMAYLFLMMTVMIRKVFRTDGAVVVKGVCSGASAIHSSAVPLTIHSAISDYSGPSRVK
jgi:hypothetical protein